jgi:hypothetical protein
MFTYNIINENLDCFGCKNILKVVKNDDAGINDYQKISKTVYMILENNELNKNLKKGDKFEYTLLNYSTFINILEESLGLSSEEIVKIGREMHKDKKLITEGSYIQIDNDSFNVISMLGMLKKGGN